MVAARKLGTGLGPEVRTAEEMHIHLVKGDDGRGLKFPALLCRKGRDTKTCAKEPFAQTAIKPVVNALLRTATGQTGVLLTERHIRH